jgi:catechol 2,3-dioxygenase-like lactoylglutathione lyase family enzyme
MTSDLTGATAAAAGDSAANATSRRTLMSSIDVGSTAAPDTAELSTIDMAIEVVTLPVSDVDRAKAFYQRLGWRLDIDFKPTPDTRGVQFTPPHSPCSIQFGVGATTAAPGSAQKTFLVVDDIDAARDELIGRGVDVSEVQEMRPPGLDGPDRSYFARATFSDPDGNSYVLQQVNTRLPGRTWDD